MEKPARRDEVVDQVAELLRERLQATFDRFCEELPEIVRELRAGRSPGSAGPEFVETLLAWIAKEPSRKEQANRYLLMWYAKTLAGKEAHDVPDCRAVATLLRQHLGAADLAEVDRALAGSWESLARGRSLVVLASRQRLRFLDTLSPEQRRRFAPYLSAFLAVPIWGGGPGAAAHASPGLVTPAQPSAWLGAAALALGLPLVAGVAWYLARGHDEAPASGPPPHDAGEPPRPMPVEQPPVVAGSRLVPDAGPGDEGLRLGARPSFRWKRPSSGVSSTLQGVAWSGAVAVVVGADGTIVRSSDTMIWEATLVPVRYSYHDLAWGNGVFVAVGTSQPGTHVGRLSSTSVDGESWEHAVAPEHAALSSIAFGRGRFVAATTFGSVAWSEDGRRWAEVAPPPGLRVSAVSFVADRFVARTADGALLSSSDGEAWREVAPTRYAALSSNLVPWNGGYLMVGNLEHGGPGQVGHSSDLVAWSVREIPGVPALFHLAVAGHQLTAAGADGVFTSVDGETWERELTAPGGAMMLRLAWAGSRLIVVGRRGTILVGTLDPAAEGTP